MTLPHLRFRWAGCAVAAIAFLLGAVPVHASTQPPAIKPAHSSASSYLSYTLGPAQKTSDGVVLTDVTPDPADYVIYPVDGYTSPSTGVVYQDRPAPVVGVGTWISLGATTAHLVSGRSATVHLTVSVPPGTPPGDYVGAIMAENAASARSGSPSGMALNVRQRAGLAVVIHVPGPTHIGFTLGPASLHVENGSRQVLDIPMQSTANVLVKPVMDMTLRSCSEQPVMSVTGQQLDTFTAMASIVYPHPFDTLVLTAGCYLVDVTIGYQGTTLDHRTTTLQVTPAQADVRAPALRAAGVPPASASGGVAIPSWLLALLGLLVAVNLVLLATILQRRHSKKGRKRAPVNG
jgi:hypothetical protein